MVWKIKAKLVLQLRAQGFSARTPGFVMALTHCGRILTTPVDIEASNRETFCGF